MTSLDIDRIRRELPGRRIDYYATHESTMLAAAGLPVGSAAIAEEQTAGQGRIGHSWHSEPGAGIYCSMVLKPMPVLTLALGLAVQSAIAEATGVMCDIRWPNDLMIGGRKVAGILVQVVEGNAVCGIGINVNHKAFPPELEGEATSLLLQRGKLQGPGARDRGPGDQDRPGGRPSSLPFVEPGTPCTQTAPSLAPGPRPPAPTLSREDILIALLPAADEFAGRDKDSILRLFTQASSYACGRRVVVRQADGVIEGVTAGLDSSGFLKVRKDDGTDTLILAGGVRAAGS